MGSSIAEFNPGFQSQINALLAACPGLTIGSGYRTEQEQAALYAQKPHLAAPPGKSNHGKPEVGAVDLEGDLDCAHRMAAQFGLHFPMDHEPWHIESLNPGQAIDQQAYTDPVEQRMVDIEGMLFGGANHLDSPIFTPDAEEANAAYQDGKPAEVLADELPAGLDMASFAEQQGTAGTYEQAVGFAPYVPTDITEGLPGGSGGGGGAVPRSVGGGTGKAARPKEFGGGKGWEGGGGGGGKSWGGGQSVGEALAATGPGQAQGSGQALSPTQAASYLAAAGFRGEALVTAVAIAIGESGLRANAHGDTSIAKGGWGHSIGLMQIRSRTGEAGSGAPRDPTRLEDPLFNAKAAWEISGGGTNFKPWTVFTKGIYRQNLDTARQAVASLGNLGGAQPQAQGAPEFTQRLDVTGAGIIRPEAPTALTRRRIRPGARRGTGKAWR